MMQWRGFSYFPSAKRFCYSALSVFEGGITRHAIELSDVGGFHGSVVFCVFPVGGRQEE
jgi:hypothetical protein